MGRGGSKSCSVKASDQGGVTITSQAGEGVQPFTVETSDQGREWIQSSSVKASDQGELGGVQPSSVKARDQWGAGIQSSGVEASDQGGGRIKSSSD